jgi:DNA-binding response OmpR family regulator
MPILMLTARTALGDRLAGLNSGADDYLGKPFDLDELVARCDALLRRASGRAAPTITHGALHYDPAAQTVTLNDVPVTLSARELALFDILITNIGRILGKQQIEERLYRWDEMIESNTVEVHVSHLRRKIGRDLIQTVRGLGYVMPKLP